MLPVLPRAHLVHSISEVYAPQPAVTQTPYIAHTGFYKKKYINSQFSVTPGTTLGTFTKQKILEMIIPKMNNAYLN